MNRTRGAARGALLALALGCSRAERPDVVTTAQAAPSVATKRAPTPPGLLPAEERTWSFEKTPVGRMSVVVLLPERRADERFPMLIAMHGRGEALKGPVRGARGWVDDYAVGRALARLAAPPLRPRDFESFVAEARLGVLNRALAEKPYRGLVLVFPYTPDMLAGEEPFTKAPPLARFLVDELIPRLHRETPVLAAATATGIDGVSLGGRAAWSVALLRPQAFGAVGGLQPAFDVDDAGDVTERAVRARVANAALRFRLLTSTEDYFRPAVLAIGRSMTSAGLPVQVDVVEGPHDYAFNRGPGAIEMLVFHDRALRGESTP